MSTDEKRGTSEGRLLAAAMLVQQPKRWKAPQLANKASMSTDWVRDILRGYRSVGKGKSSRVIPKPETLATLADALGNITGEQLSEIGRSDAAAALAIIRSERAGGHAHERLAMLRAELDELAAKLGEGDAERAAAHPRVQMPTVDDGQ